MSDYNSEYEYESELDSESDSESDKEECKNEVNIYIHDDLYKKICKFINISPKSGKFLDIYNYINDNYVFYKNFTLDSLISYINENRNYITENEYLFLINKVSNLSEQNTKSKKDGYNSIYEGEKTEKVNIYNDNNNNKDYEILKDILLDNNTIHVFNDHTYIYENFCCYIVELLSNENNLKELKDLCIKFFKNNKSLKIKNKILYNYIYNIKSENYFSKTIINHHYKNTITKNNNVKDIYKQLKELQKPDSLYDIYFITDENNISLFKFMIIGKKDTPYKNGCFIFDGIFDNFPNEPPKITFMTTGNGKIRFNPNLYSNGKVCLSILNTWSGPSWNPEGSTILQILISIQAFIFNEKPYYNEPGYKENEERSKYYNKTISEYTLKHAILNYKEIMDDDFKEIITNHLNTLKL